jgi:uncharacterized membrane protein YkvA (DUF1232 family)
MNIPVIGEVKFGSMGKTILFLLSLLYVISPIDLIPDVIPIVGWIDDLVVLLFGALPIARDLFGGK